jgi:hypothetical protein
MITALFNTAKKKVTEQVAAMWLSKKMTNIGQIVRLDFDAKARQLTVEVQLHGEDRTHTVTLADYVISRTPEGRCQIVVGRAVADRPWLENVLKQYVVGRAFAFHLPPSAWPFVEMAIGTIS